MSAIAAIGRFFLNFCRQTGRLSVFVGQTLWALFQPPFYPHLIGQQIMRIGYHSLPVVAMTSFFTGGVLALQIHYGSDTFNSETFVATIVALGITRELGPVLSGLMVAGRASSAIAAEIGTMRVTEQIDALTTLSTDPFKYLVAPRVLAAIISLPILTLIADVIGIAGGFVVGTQALDFDPAIYLQSTFDYLDVEAVASGLFKALAFGFIIAVMGCYHGYFSNGGAQGVGRATTHAVVAASVLVLAGNYLMTSLLFAS